MKARDLIFWVLGWRSARKTEPVSEPLRYTVIMNMTISRSAIITQELNLHGNMDMSIIRTTRMGMRHE